MPISKRRKKKTSQHAPNGGFSAATPVQIGPKAWVAPAMIASLLIGLVWIVIFYLAGNQIGFMRSLGNLGNVGVGFGFIGIGFILSTRWR